MRRLTHFLLTAVLGAAILLPVSSRANPALSYQGRILKSDGEPFELPTAQFRIEIRSPLPSDCRLYRETRPINMANSNGFFKFQINDGAVGVTVLAGSLPIEQALSNRKALTLPAGNWCADNSGIYTPGPNDNRRMVIEFFDGSSWEAMPAIAMNPAPSAVEALQVGGFKAQNLLRVVDGSNDPHSVSPLTNTQYDDLIDLLSGTSLLYTKPNELAGQPLPALGAGQDFYWNGTTWVAYTPVTGVEGFAQTALPACAPGHFLRNDGTGQFQCVDPGTGGSVSILTGTGLTGGPITSTGTIELEALHGAPASAVKPTYDVYGRVTGSGSLAETDLPTISTAGKVSGDAITSGTIAGTTAINTSGNITSSGEVYADTLNTTQLILRDTGVNTIVIEAPTLGGSYVLVMPDSNGNPGQLLSTDGNGLLSWVDPATGSINSVGVSAPIVNSGTASDPVLGISDASTAAKGAVQLAADGGTTAGTVVQANDARLSNARPPNGAATGDLDGSYPNPTVVGFAGVPLNFVSLSAGQFVKYDGTNWINAGIAVADISDFATSVDSRADARIALQKGSANGLATLDGSGKVPSSQLALSASDIPNLDTAKITTGTFGDARISDVGVDKIASGTGKYLTYRPNDVECGDGQILKWIDASNRWECANDAGAAGVVTSVSATAPLTNTGTALDPVIAITDATTSAKGAVQLATDGGTTAGTVVQATDARLSDSRAPSGTATGDLKNSYPNPTVDKIEGIDVVLTAIASGQFVKYDGTNFINSAVAIGDVSGLSTALGDKLDASVIAACGPDETLTFVSPSASWTCAAIAIDRTQVSGLGTAAQVDTGTGAGDVPVLDGTGKLDVGVMPSGVLTSESDPKVGTLTNTKWCTTDGNQVICNTDAPVLTESDPTVESHAQAAMPVTNCTASEKLAWNGSAWACVADAGITSESDPKVGTLSNGKWCVSNGTEVVCSTDEPVLTVAGRSGAVVLDYSDITSAAGKYMAYRPNDVECGDGQVLKWIDANNRWECGNDAGATGVVISVGATAPLTNTGTATEPVIAITDATTSAKGAVQLATDGGTTAGTVVQATDARLSDSRAPSGTATGDLKNSYPNPTVDKIEGIDVVLTAIASGQFVKYDGTNFINSAVGISDVSGLSTALGDKLDASVIAACGADETLTFVSPSASWTCAAIAIDRTQVSGLGTAAQVDTGTGAGDVPVLDGGGKLDVGVMPAGVLTSESDPKVGTLTNTKWCTTDGTQVICNSDAPGGGDVMLGGNTVGSTMTLGTNSNHALGLETNGSTKMMIGSDGYVGINDTTPAAQLEVVGQGTFNELATFRQNGDAGISIISDDFSRAYLTLKSEGNHTYLIANEGSGSSRKLGFHLDGGINSTPGIVFMHSGEVGIGTDSPSRLLHVAGPMRIAASTAPSSPARGDIYVDSGDNKLKYHNGTGWVDAGGSGGGGTVTSVGATAPLTNTGTATDPVIAINDATTSAKGAVQLAADGGTTAGTVVQATDARLSNSRAPSGTATGDLKNSYPNPTVDKIEGIDVVLTTIASGQFVKYDGTNFINSAVAISDVSGLSTALGDKLDASVIAACGPDETLTFVSPSASWTCASIAIAHTQVSGLGTAAQVDTGTGAGDVPVLGGGGKLDASVIPNSFLTSESDPKVGTLTNTKWCTSDGTTVNCTSDAPSGGSGDVSIGGNTVAATMAIGTNSNHDLALETNGTTKMTILADGKVGVGTASPSTSLQVNGSTTSTRFLGDGAAFGANPHYSFSSSTNTGMYLTTGGGNGLNFSLDGTQMLQINDTRIVPSRPIMSNIAGTAASPAYGFANDPDTGIFSGGLNSNVLAFSASGVERFRLHSNGFVGIGTASPSRLLHVEGPMRITASTAPGSPALGDIYVDSGDNKLKYHNGTGWVDAGGSGGGGTVTSVGATAPLTNTGTATDPVLAINDATTSAKGAVQLAADGGTTAGTVVQATDARLSNSRAPSGAATGDLGGSYPNPTVEGLDGVGLSINTLTNGNFLKYNGTNWTNSNLAISDVPNLQDSLDDKLDASVIAACGSDETLTFVSPSASWTCASIAIAHTQVSGLGTAATANTGTASGNVPVLDGSGKLDTAVLPSSVGDVLIGGNTVSSTMSLGTNSAHNFELETSGVGRLTVLATGQVGIGDSNPSMALAIGDGSAKDGSLIARGYGTVGTDGDTLSVSGAGTRLIWYPKKAALRAGRVSGTQWNDANIGLDSVALGRNTSASGSETAAFGSSSYAQGSRSVAIGYSAGTGAAANESIALGDTAFANNTSATAVGEQANAWGYGAVAIGYNTWSNGTYSTALGSNNDANGEYSTAIGPDALADGDYATSIGRYTDAPAFSQVALGSWNQRVGTENETTWVATDPLLVVGNGQSAGTKSNALMILKNGNIGMGTNAPARRLHVAGPMRIASSTAPGTPALGDIYVDSGDSKLKYHNGTGWVDAGGGTGTVTSVGATAPLTNTGTATAPVIAINDATTSAKGAVQLATDGGTTAGTVVQATDSRLTDSRAPSGAATGDLKNNYPNPTVDKIEGLDVVFTAIANGQFLKYNGTNLINASISSSDISGLGTAATANTGAASGNVPVLDGAGKLATSVESDPQVGTLTNGKWCTTDGTSVNCTSDAPGGTGDVTIGGNTVASAMTIGTNSDHSFAIETNGVTQMTVSNAGNVGIGVAPSLSRKVSIFRDTHGISLNTRAELSSVSNNAQMTGFESSATNYSSSTNLVLKGAKSSTYNGSGGSVTDMSALELSSTVEAGTVSRQSGLDIDVTSDVSGSVTNQFGLDLSMLNGRNVSTEKAISISFERYSGTVTDRYGIFLANPVLSGGSVTNDYGIFQQGSGQRNYFAGNVGIGTSSPARLLHVAGPMRLTASTAPGSPALGDIYVDSGDSKLKYHNGTGWVDAGGSGGGGTVTGVTASAPLASSGGTAPDISLNLGNGLTTVSSSLTMNIGNGLEFNSGASRVKAGDAIVVDADGVNVLTGTIAGSVMAADGVPNCAANEKLQMSLGPAYNWTCVADQGITSESDPQVGTLTNGKWCTTDGTSVNCTSDAPGGSGDVTIGGNTVGATMIVGTNSNHALALETNSTTKMTILADGKVGIGTASPDYQLHVSTSGQGDGIQVGNAFIGNHTAGSTYAMFANEMAVSNTAFALRQGQAGDTRLNSETGQNLIFAIGDTERFRLSSSGNVGIGSTSPARLLHVAGPMRLTASTAPGTPALGDIYVDSGDSKLKYHNGTGWVDAGGGAGGLPASAGDATTPGYAFSGDTNTGMFGAAADTIGFSTGGVQRAQISSVGLDVTGRASVSQNHTGTGSTSAIEVDLSTYIASAQGPTIKNAGLNINSSGGTSNGSAVGRMLGVASYAGYDSGNGGVNEVVSGEFLAQKNTGGSAGAIHALRAESGAYAGGTISKLSGLTLKSDTFAGTTTDQYGIEITDVAKTGTGVVTNRYGLHIATFTGTVTNNDFGIFQQGTSQRNFFAGNVGVGTQSPARLLHVAGPMRITASTAPASPALGDMYIDSGDSKLKYHNGTGWVEAGGAGGGVSSVGATAPLVSSGGSTPNISVNLGDGLTTVSSSLTMNIGNGLEFNSSAARVKAGTAISVNGSGVNVITGTVSGAVMAADGVPSCASNQKLQMSLGPAYNWTCVTDETGGGGGGSSQWSDGASSAIYYNTGNVGVGTSSPAEKIHVVGNVQADGYITSSDRRLKSDITDIDGLDLIRRLRGVWYRRTATGQPEYGVIAQEVEAVDSSLVVTDPNTGIKSVKYQGLIAPLIEAVKETDLMCRTENAKLRQEVSELREEVAELKKMVHQLLQKK